MPQNKTKDYLKVKELGQDQLGDLRDQGHGQVDDALLEQEGGKIRRRLTRRIAREGGDDLPGREGSEPMTDRCRPNDAGRVRTVPATDATLPREIFCSWIKEISAQAMGQQDPPLAQDQAMGKGESLVRACQKSATSGSLSR